MDSTIRLDCLGGFVVTHQYGLARATSDIDVLAIVPRNGRRVLLEAGQFGSALHKRWGVYLQFVPVVVPPEDYEQRLTEMYAGTF
ncbi:MAG: hypothetical protein ABI383_02385 [Acidobacteriaceae bacterium]